MYKYLLASEPPSLVSFLRKWMDMVSGPSHSALYAGTDAARECETPADGHWLMNSNQGRTLDWARNTRPLARISVVFAA